MTLAIRDIQYFLAVAKSGLLSSAAEACGVTQPALTKAVQRVEAEFGLPLFQRTARGMVLTAAGERMVEQMLRLQADYADTVLLSHEMRAQQAGLLRLGLTDATARSVVVPVLAELLAHRPGLRLRVHIDRSDVLTAQVQDGVLDTALVPAYEGQTLVGEWAKVGSDPMFPVVRAGHPLAEKSRLELQDFATCGWILGGSQSAVFLALSDIFARSKLPAPRLVMEVPHVSEFSLGIVALTDLVTLVPQSLMRQTQGNRFAVLPIAPLRLPRSIVLLSRTGSASAHWVQTLREALIQRWLASPEILGSLALPT